jgi:hypothetical protein
MSMNDYRGNGKGLLHKCGAPKQPERRIYAAARHDLTVSLSRQTQKRFLKSVFLPR